VLKNILILWRDLMSDNTTDVKTKKCKSCGTEAVKLAKVCQQCGTKFKSLVKKLLIGVGVLAILGGIMSASSAHIYSTSITAKVADKTPEQITPEKKWTVTNSWSGNDGTEDTENFAVTENTRINLETTNVRGIIQIYVHDSQGTLVELLASMKGTGNDVSYLHITPGQYSLKINAANTSWKITVECAASNS
jgi:hypothetical protein